VATTTVVIGSLKMYALGALPIFLLHSNGDMPSDSSLRNKISEGPHFMPLRQGANLKTKE